MLSTACLGIEAALETTLSNGQMSVRARLSSQSCLVDFGLLKKLPVLRDCYDEGSVSLNHVRARVFG